MKQLSIVISIAFFLCVFSAQSYAQVWSVGPAVGVNFSTIKGDNDDASQWKPGFIGGAVINYSSIRHFGFSANVLYAQYGARYEPTDLKTNLNYVQIPFYAVWYGGTLEDDFRPKIYVGPYVSFLVSAKDGGGRDINPNGDVFNEIDGGLIGGVGFNYRLSPGVWLNTDLRYSLGLADLNAGATTDKAFNHGIGAMVGVAFSLNAEE